jgi:heme-degrading monooxygenase HmoA
MISRYWMGVTKPGEAENYIAHLRTDTFPKLSEISGFIEASILKRAVAQGTEFLIITVWESIEAIERFAGATADIAVVPEVVQAMMVEYDKKVRHYEVAENFNSGCVDGFVGQAF